MKYEEDIPLIKKMQSSGLDRKGSSNQESIYFFRDAELYDKWFGFLPEQESQMQQAYSKAQS